MAFQLVKGYAGLLYVILSISIFDILEKPYFASLLIFIKTFISNFLLCFLNFCDSLSYLKISIKEKIKLIKSSVARIRTIASEKFWNDWNSAISKFGKTKIFCDYGIKLLLNVILPLADFVTDIYFAVGICGVSDWIFKWSGIFILYRNIEIENQTAINKSNFFQ